MNVADAQALFARGYTLWLEMPAYDILLHEPTQEPAIRCRKCLMVSDNPNDVREKYCGNCHEFHERG